MKSIQTKIIGVISAIMVIVVATFLIVSTARTNAILKNDSEQILRTAADHYANIIDETFRSTEQSVGTIYNYANKRAETYRDFLVDEKQRDLYTYDVSELGKSIAENTRGGMSVYLRYNPKEYDPISGFWYTIKLEDNTWQPSVPTDMSVYEEDDIEHVGWYYIPVNAGTPMWMDPYYNANLGVDMISYIIPYYFGGKTVGIIGMDISMELLKEAVAEVSLYDSGRAFLMAKSGDIIYAEDYPAGIAFEELKESDKTYFSSFSDFEFDSIVICRGRDGLEQKVILKELKNGMILGIYAPVAEINAPQSELLRQQFLVSVMILFFAISMCLIWVRSITNPIQKMKQVAEHYANGDFDEQISVHRNDELGVLSNSLQTMATSLKQQIDIADSANRAKSEFLANMSHEIRTPINAVLGMNEMIMRESKEENILDYADGIRSSGRTLLALINSILDFSKIEDGKMEILSVPYDTAVFIHDQVATVTERARDKGLDVKITVDETLPTRLQGDDVRIGQVLNNLLTNAVKYTEAGEVRLFCSCKKVSDTEVDVRYEISDTGIGIRSEDIQKMTESFSRLDEKRNRNIEGTGLGMAIVTRLLAMMNSKLEVESVYGVGSKFSFVLRQKIVDPTPLGDYAEHEKRHVLAVSEEKKIVYRDAKILVVDDHEMNLKVAKSLLGVFGITPDLATGGMEAIKKVQEKRYNIIFLDHMMPQIDGIETLHRMKSQGHIDSNTTVVALTANAIVGARETYLSSGFDDYLSKPIEMDELKKMLTEYLPADLATEVEAEIPQPVKEDRAEISDTEKTDMAEAQDDNSLSDAKDSETILKNAGIDESVGIKNSVGSRELFMELLADFEAEHDDRESKLKQAFADGNREDYRFLLHGLKGVSRTIGATELSTTAETMELYVKSHDDSGTEEELKTLLDLYIKAVSGIREVLEK